MNFFDLCVVCWRALGRGCKAFGRLLARMVRLSFRYWWLVLAVLALFIAAALYYSREDNIKYPVNAVVLLNGPSVQQFEQVLNPLIAGRNLPENSILTTMMKQGKVTRFETFRVIDCLHDETPDFIDYKHKTHATDTVNVILQDRLCLQFRMKTRHLDSIWVVENALLDYLNSNEVLQQAYVTYKANLQEEVAFNHRQAQKLDSLTSCYYYQSATSTIPSVYASNGVSFYGERKIRLFLQDIYKQHAHLQRADQRLLLATNPVTLENHFAVYPNPVNGRRKCIIIFFLFGWCFACGLAEIIDRRKEIIAWLKK